MDLLSDVLKLVTVKGAVFYNAEYSAPWSFRSPPSQAITPYFGASAAHVVLYHVLTEGRAWVQLEEGPRAGLTTGDIVIFPHGDAHFLGNGAPAEPVDHGKQLDLVLSRGLAVTRAGGGGEVTKFVCGYMLCDPQVGRLVLAGLPPLVRVNVRDDPSGSWLENAIRFSVTNASAASAGAEAVLAKLSEALFVETLRRYIATLPPAQTGWLGGARDPEVGRALGLLHRQPARPWTVGELAAEVGVSRAVLAQRFQHYLGEPPMGYLTRWRLQLGARLLTTTSHTVGEIAARVGYDSEAAFNRAFKRQFGLPPARFRTASKSGSVKTNGAVTAA
jgi:AraC-like DNA-binding protein